MPAVFAPQTYTIQLTTNATGSTANSTQLTGSGLNYLHGPDLPPQVRIVNTGAAPVFVSFTSTSTTIAAPTAGAANGTSTIILMPGVVEVFTLPHCVPLFVNDISTASSQPYYMIFGEGG